MSRVAILLVAALILGAQCFAACALFPCTPEVASSSCHHKQNSSPAPCGHQLYVSESGRSVDTLVSEFGNFLAIVPAEIERSNNALACAEPVSHPSPPEATGTAGAVLRI